jgi:hypothetical protein
VRLLARGRIAEACEWIGPEEGFGIFPKKGGVYSARALRPWQDTVALLLAEIVNPVLAWDGGNVGELGFYARRFRPAKTTSLEVFERMFAPDLKTA